MYLNINQYVRGGGLTVNNIRNKVADYFVTDVTDAEEASWQMSKI